MLLEQFVHNYDFRFGIEDLNECLYKMTELDGSDLYITGGEKIAWRRFGRNEFITKKPISIDDSYNVITAVYGENARSFLGGGGRIDKEYEFKKTTGSTNGRVKSKRLRFRLNAVGVPRDGSPSLRITLRAIPVDIPKIETLGMDMNLVNYCRDLSSGLVLVVGPTGSGKSTTLASMMQYQMETPESHIVLSTIEAPIEFVYDKVKSDTSVFAQMEVGKNVESFAAGLSNCLRMAQTHIIVGEARDQETISSAIEAGITGHVVYSTTHSSSVLETIQRMISAFPIEFRSDIKIQLISALRLIIAQRLVKTKNGKRVAIRESLVFNRTVRERLLSADNLEKEIIILLEEFGQPMINDVERVYKEGLIDEDVYRQLVMNSG